ncbi:unnamed protein product [Schistosoma margrebowiei]|uniref:Uncharacterized protein n=1 Tax=Schistosoma margrebowiei TaxID=48269 RepID=A0A183MXE0_9TREM|nr:unnamed protein product [Schistosoma margrebowiei]
MKMSTSEGKHGIQWTSKMQLDDLDSADGLALLSQNATTNAAEDDQCRSSLSSNRYQYTQREKQDSPIKRSMKQYNQN